MNIDSNQQKIIKTKGHTLLWEKKVPVNWVVLSGLLSSWRSHTDPTSNTFSYFSISWTHFKMSWKDLLLPYINRFRVIHQQMSYARLKLCCKDRKVTVNFNHDLKVIPTVDYDVLNIFFKIIILEWVIKVNFAIFSWTLN